MARDTATGFPWVKSFALMLPSLALALGGGLQGIATPLGAGMIAAGCAYLVLHLIVLQPRVEASARTDADLAELVREVVVHEVAHYFGIDDDRLDELGW